MGMSGAWRKAVLRWSGLVCALQLLLPQAAVAVDVLLRWTVPPEHDLAGYRLYLGSESRAYETRLDVVPQAATVADGVVGYVLTEGRAEFRYAAVTAVNLAGLESDYSNEKHFSETVERLPRADAGPDRSVNMGAVLVVGSPAEPGTTYLWRQIAGPPGLAFVAPFASETEVRVASPGTYEIEVAAGDERQGFASRDRVVVSVRNAATPTAAPQVATPTPVATRSPSPVSWPPPGASMFGEILYYGGSVPVGDVEVEVFDGQSPGWPRAASVRTDGAGRFAVFGLASGTWLVRPRSNAGTEGAVTALDAAYVFQAVAGTRELNALLETACDTDGDGFLTELDGRLIMQRAVGTLANLPVSALCGGEWLFDPFGGEPGEALHAGVARYSCQSGAFRVDTAGLPVGPLQFRAVPLGDCTGGWHWMITDGQ